MKKIYFVLAMLILTVSSAWGQAVTDRSSAGDPMTYDQFKAFAGTGKRFAIVASSANTTVAYPKWFSFATGGNPETLTTAQLFVLENSTTGEGWYNIKRVSDEKYVSTEGGNFANSPKMDFKLVNRRAGDYAPEFENSNLHVSLDNAAGNHYNANTVNLGFRGGTGGYSTYITYGPFYIATINCIDSKTKETIQVMENAIMRGGSFPSITDYVLTSDPTSGAGITADGEYEFEFTKAIKVENTYKYVLGGKEIASYTFQDEKDIAPAGMLTLPSYVTLESTDAPEVCAETASTFTYNVQYNNLPFELGTPYSLTIRDDATPQYNIYVDPADETKVKTIRNTNEKWTTPTLGNFNYFNWVMGGDFYNGFTFQNVATGKYLTYGANVSPADNTIATIIDEPNAGSKFILSIKNNRNCFKIKDTTNNTFINKRGDDLSTWASSNADGETGSAITFCEPIEVYSTTVDLNLTDDAGNVFSATVPGKAGTVPHLTGAEGYTLSEEVWDGSTLTAKITFPFPTSSDQVKNPTAIQSALGESKWYANADGKLKANNKANTNPLYSNQDNWNWYIYPEFNDGVFTFKLYNVGAEKYIPTITASNQNTATELSDEAGSFQFAEVRTNQYGFYLPSANKFLTIMFGSVNENIWLWSASGGHMGSTMSFPDAIVVTLEDMQAKLAVLANTTKFELVEGATVISPSEYAAPSEINAAIDAANAVDNNDPVAIETFLSSDDANKIKQFNNASTSHGAPLTTNYVANAGYNTIILPINWTIPTNWKVYSCSETSGNALTLVEQSTATKNRPYIIKTEANETFQFIGYSNGADTENVKTAGILAGANFATTAPAGSYILTNGSDRFEKVYEDTEVAANQCWITLDSKAAYLLFEAQPTPAKATANMRITDAGWGTFYAPFAVAIPEGVKAYTGTLITESETPWIRMDELTEGVIPANTGVVVAKKVEGEAYSEDLEEIETAVATASTCYTGNAYNYNVVVEEGAYLLQKNYVAEKQENVVGWYKVQGKGFTLAPNRCYLAKNTVPEASQARSFIGFEPVDDATGISSIATEAKTKADGKYMVKGQIVVVKAGKAYYMNGTEVK